MHDKEKNCGTLVGTMVGENENGKIKAHSDSAEKTLWISVASV